MNTNRTITVSTTSDEHTCWDVRDNDVVVGSVVRLERDGRYAAFEYAEHDTMYARGDYATLYEAQGAIA